MTETAYTHVWMMSVMHNETIESAILVRYATSLEQAEADMRAEEENARAQNFRAQPGVICDKKGKVKEIKWR